MDKKNRISELVELLNKASKAYYQDDEEIMSNFEYDRLYDELVMLEKQTGIVLSTSPTSFVGYEAVDELPKQRHAYHMLSLDKTKDREELRSWLKDQKALLSWKLDGLTVVLTYENGQLSNAVTRGNGEIGEVITNNARTFINIPLSISYTGNLIVRGEAVIGYSDFERINDTIDNPDEKYKNPRNLCSGSVRALNNEVTASRSVRFIAFSFVSSDEISFNTRTEQMEFLASLGFECVEYHLVDSDTILDEISSYAAKIESFDIPSDGLVLSYDDLEYSKSLGRTAKFPKDSIAFKWADEIKNTKLLEIEWSPSRTGLINPVAIFTPVELEGTTVSRASVHNISILEELMLGIGDEISVYKANMIIPQIAENLTRSKSVVIPSKCPCCNGDTEVKMIKMAKSLYCTNPDCPAKQIKRFTHFVSRDAMNIEGLSEATLEKFVDLGFIKSYSDIYNISEHKEEIIGLEGFGEKSYNNLCESIKQSRNVHLANFVYSLGIPGVGLSNAKLICRAFDYDFDRIFNLTSEDLVAVDKIGDVIAASFDEYVHNKGNALEIEKLRELMIFPKEDEVVNDSPLSGKSIVITGSLNMFSNRKEMQKAIEAKGGIVAGSVSKSTFVLVNNDINSSSSKNKTAKQNNIPIMTEEDFVKSYL